MVVALRCRQRRIISFAFGKPLLTSSGKKKHVLVKPA
jgi:hypothetical protein